MICDRCKRREWCTIKCQLWHLERGGGDGLDRASVGTDDTEHHDLRHHLVSAPRSKAKPLTGGRQRLGREVR